MSATIRSPIRGFTLLAAAAVAVVTLAGSALAAKTDSPATDTYTLKDGTKLVVARNGWMRMFTAEGKRLHMKDGVSMETRDGDVIAMKEDLNWKQLRLFGTLSPRSR